MSFNDQPVDLSGAEWRKSARSNSQGGACVEVARNLPGVIAVRDSKNPNGPALVFTPAECWTASSVRRDGCRTSFHGSCLGPGGVRAGASVPVARSAGFPLSGEPV
ncbi:DUF397 domain-containing protein [Streptosporangium sp. OZ121]|uniref:DUF397 domain-containing protein n=1 Tax=Streptosporangium sp. OZ121 TaxID=3444183 RepID=UPI003F7A1590